jgi:hypothetical protein
MSTFSDALDTAPYLCYWVFHPLFPNTEKYSIQTSQEAISKAVRPTQVTRPRVKVEDVEEQLAMARLPRATFALLLSLLPASAALIGVIVLRQVPRFPEVAGILLVASGVALHKEAQALPKNRTKDDRPIEPERPDTVTSLHMD